MAEGQDIDLKIAPLADPGLPPGFKCLGVLGEGAFGVVYKVLLQHLQQVVAVKVFRNISNEEKVAQRMTREAKAISKLEHKNIVKLLQVGYTTSGAPFLVYEFLDGVTLLNALNSKRLSLLEIDQVFKQVLSGLSYIHSAGFIHRDIKPGNIMIVREGLTGSHKLAKILDFGIARQIDEFGQGDSNTSASTATTTTSTSLIHGSPNYMSPEQCQGKALDLRSDLYSVGCMLYECFVGAPLFDGSSNMDIMYKQIHVAAPLIPELNQGRVFQKKLQDLMNSLLSKNPNDRPSSASQVQERLSDLMEIASASEARGSKPATMFLMLVAVIVLGSGIFFLSSAMKNSTSGALVGSSPTAASTAPSDSLFSTTSIAGSSSNLNLKTGAELQRSSRMSSRRSVSAQLADIGAESHSKFWENGRTEEYVHALLNRLQVLSTKTKDQGELYAIHELRAYIFQANKQFEKALEEEEAALKLCGDKNGLPCFQAAQCHYHIGVLLALAGKNLGLVEKELLKADDFIKRGARDPDHYFTLGVKDEFFVLENNSFESKLFKMLAEHYMRKGDLLKSRIYYNKATDELTHERKCLDNMQLRVGIAELVFREKGKQAARAFMRDCEREIYDVDRRAIFKRRDGIIGYYSQMIEWCLKHKWDDDASFYEKRRAEFTEQSNRFTNLKVLKGLSP